MVELPTLPEWNKGQPTGLPVTTRCSTCRMIHETARSIMDAHPQVRGQIGSPSIAVHRLELALGGLDALGITSATTLDRRTNTANDVRRLLSHLTVPGGSVQWISRLVGEGRMRWSQMRPSEPRWSHIEPGERRVLQQAYADMYAKRIEKPKRYPCPSDDGKPSGCMLCGVSHIEELPSIARERGLWVEMEADPSTIGSEGAEALDGYVCDACDEAIDLAGGVGYSAMARSVLDFLGLPRYIRSFQEVGGLRGWAALPRGTKPNVKPWDHLYLDTLREEVQAFMRASGAAYGDYQPLQLVGYMR